METSEAAEGRPPPLLLLLLLLLLWVCDEFLQISSWAHASSYDENEATLQKSQIHWLLLLLLPPAAPCWFGGAGAGGAIPILPELLVRCINGGCIN